MRLVSLAAAATTLLLGASAHAAECMRANKDGEIAEGRVSAGRFQDAAGRPEQAYILTLPVATCLRGDGEEDNLDKVRRIHIYSTDAKVHGSIRRFVGKTVLVRGNAFAQHTAHHHAPIVMNITEIDQH